MLQARRSQFRFPRGSIGFFIDLYLKSSGRTIFLGSTQPLTEMSTWGISWVVRRGGGGGGDGSGSGGGILSVSRADSLDIAMYQLSRTSTSWSPKVLPRTV